MRFVIVRKARPFRGERWMWRMVADNNEVLAVSELYHRREDALDAVFVVKSLAPTARVEQVDR